MSSIGIMFIDVVVGRWSQLVGRSVAGRCRNAVSCKDLSQIRGYLPDANSQGFCLNPQEYPGIFANRSLPFADSRFFSFDSLLPQAKMVKYLPWCFYCARAVMRKLHYVNVRMYV
jgi:hypothetical protein